MITKISLIPNLLC